MSKQTYFMQEDLQKLEKKRKSLVQKITEYEKAEKYFGVDKKGSLIYDLGRDQQYALDNLTKQKDFSGYASFMEWVDDKSKSDLKKELSKIDDKIEELKNVTKVMDPSEEQK
jgi:hypothetical protein